MGQELLQLRIQRHRGLIAPALVEHLFHQLPEPGQGADGAGLAERQQEPGAGSLQPEAAMGVGVSVCVAMAAQHRTATAGGAGSRTRDAGQRAVISAMVGAAAPRTPRPIAETPVFA